MAIVAVNPLPVDTFTVGKRVVWYDPGFTVAGRKEGVITAVHRGVSGSDAELSIDVLPDGGSAITAQAPQGFRVIDKFEDNRPNV